MRQNIGKNRAETAFQRVKNLLALVFFFVKTRRGNAGSEETSGKRVATQFLSTRERGMKLKKFATEKRKKHKKNKLLTALKSALRIIH